MPSREDSAESISLEDTESTYSGTSGNESHRITQEDLNDLARDLYLSKQQSLILASRLKQWNLVQEDVRITNFWNRNKDLASFFDMENTLLTVCGTINCVIVSSKYIDSISVLYLSCFFCYKLLQLLKYVHIFSVYTKMRLFKSQKTRGDRAKVFINLNSAHPN